MVLMFRDCTKYLCALCIGGLVLDSSWAIDNFHDYEYLELDSSHSDDCVEINPLIAFSNFSDEDFSYTYSTEESSSEGEVDRQNQADNQYIFDFSTEGSSSEGENDGQNQDVEQDRFDSSREESSSEGADYDQNQKVDHYPFDSSPSESFSGGEDDGQTQEGEDYRFESSNDLISGVIRELASLQADADAYVMCHSDLKTLIQKGNLVYQCLLRMKELSMAANSDLISHNNRNMLDIEFMAQSETIPMVLKLGADQLSLGTDPQVLIFPDEQTIKIPTFKPIVDSLGSLNMRTREEAIKAQDAVDILLPKTAEIICGISAQADKMFKLIMMNDQLTQRAQEKLRKFGF